MKLHNIKEILEGRRIEVSENSWEKLASQLDANDQKKKRRNFFPYAACLALLVGLIVFMLAKDSGASQGETIVDTQENTKEIQQTDSPNILPVQEEIVEKIVQEVVVVQEELIIKEVEKSLQKQQLLPKEKQQMEVVLHREIPKPVSIDKEKVVPIELETIITQKEVVVDSNSALKASIVALSSSEKITITDEEIDALLKEAQKSIEHLNIQENFDITTIVSADDLLNEVEYELDKSFKQKVFELIKSNIQKTRTVIADRN